MTFVDINIAAFWQSRYFDESKTNIAYQAFSFPLSLDHFCNILVISYCENDQNSKSKLQATDPKQPNRNQFIPVLD